jgi:hypothetical protein
MLLKIARTIQMVPVSVSCRVFGLLVAELTLWLHFFYQGATPRCWRRRWRALGRVTKPLLGGALLYFPPSSQWLMHLVESLPDSSDSTGTALDSSWSRAPFVRSTRSRFLIESPARRPDRSGSSSGSSSGPRSSPNPFLRPRTRRGLQRSDLARVDHLYRVKPRGAAATRGWMMNCSLAR